MHTKQPRTPGLSSFVPLRQRKGAGYPRSMSSLAVQQGALRLHEACACASIGRFSPGNAERKYERSRPFQIIHLSLDLDVDLENKAVDGAARLNIKRRARSGTHLHLDAVGFSLGAITLSVGNGKPQTLSERTDYSYDGEEIVIRLPADFAEGTLQIQYRAV